jgi:8-oxo-dGTP pyrophosphatase MutT (NUDIX family)
MKIVDQPDLLSILKQKLQEPLPNKEALEMMFPRIKAMPESIPNDAKLSAVMILLFHKNEEWHFLTIRRTEDGHAHSGQIGFPGGRQEPGDTDLMETALRETYEEIGIEQHQIKTIGSLSPVYIPISNYQVFPYIGFVEEMNHYKLSIEEVKEVIEIPLSTILRAQSKVQAEISTNIEPPIKRTVNAYKLPDETIIWGATAIMIAELELILSS